MYSEEININSSVFKSLHLCAVVHLTASKSSRLYLAILHLVKFIDQAIWFLRQKLLHMPLFPGTVHVNQKFSFLVISAIINASWTNSNTIQLTQITLDNVDSSKDQKLRIYPKRGLNKGHFLFSVRCYIFCNNWMFRLSITHFRTKEKARRPKLFWYSFHRTVNKRWSCLVD